MLYTSSVHTSVGPRDPEIPGFDWLLSHLYLALNKTISIRKLIYYSCFHSFVLFQRFVPATQTL